MMNAFSKCSYLSMPSVECTLDLNCAPIDITLEPRRTEALIVIARQVSDLLILHGVTRH